MATAQKSSGLYACGVCRAEYARADYLIRHVRSHTRQRPFVCSVCAKAFARQDLLKRHTTIHNTNDNGRQGGTAVSGLQDARHAHRVHQACRPCAEKKLKCADEKPCRRCREKNIVCKYDSSSQRPTQNAPIDTPASRSLNPFSGTITESQDDGNGFALDDDDSAFQVDFERSLPAEMPFAVAPSDHHIPMPQQEPIVHAILGDNLNFPPMGDYIQCDSDPMLEDLDFSFLNDVGPSVLPSPLPVAIQSNPSPQHSAMSVGAEAYKNSTALTSWSPRKEDHDQDQQDLVLPQNLEHSSHSRGNSDGRATPNKDMFHTARDQILAMILRNTSGPTSSRILASFPSLDILRDLIHHGLNHMKERQVSNFIHIPSFDINKQRPELLGAIIAYGSVTSPSPAVRKFGYALQETTRVAIDQLIKEDFGALRELGVAQAFYIQLYLGYYSGVNRKIEMAEANSMLGVTILRRGKRLRTDQYRPPKAFMALSDISLDEKWHMWVEQESFKRLVYFAISLDFHVAPSRSINALFSCHEIGTPLPAPRRLWNAGDAADWSEVLSKDITLRSQQSLPLCQMMRQPHLMATGKRLMDQKLAAATYLAGFWSLVEEYWNMNGLARTSQTTGDFVSNSRHSELLSMLEQFTAHCTDQDDYGPEIQILQELVFLHLHVSFRDIAHYCGSGSKDDALASAPYVQQWYQSPQSRAAAWHAGQIFRAAKSLPSGALTDIYVIAIYHAGLVAWIWGLLRKLESAIADPGSSMAVIDGEETLEVRRFLKTGRSQPCMTDLSGAPFSLDDSARVPELAKDIVARHWGQESRPWTTEETFRFMAEFANVTRQKFGEGPI